MKAFRAGVIFFVVGPPLAGFLSIAAIELINFTGTSFGQAIGSSAILVIAGFWLVYLIGGLPALITGLTVAWLHPLTTYPVKVIAMLVGLFVGLLWGFLLSARYPDLEGLPPVLAIASAIASLVCSALVFRVRRTSAKDAVPP